MPREDIFLDVGAGSKEEAEALGIRPGDPIAPASSFAVLAQGRYAGKALDDRVGCVMLLETLRRLKEQGIRTPNTLYFVGTVQEEVGLRGAHTAVEAVKPDLGISLEAGIAADHPGGDLTGRRSVLGRGRESTSLMLRCWSISSCAISSNAFSPTLRPLASTAGSSSICRPRKIPKAACRR